MISILLPNLGGGGAERVCLDLAREFSRQGHQVEFVLMRAEGDLLPLAQRDFLVIDLGLSRTRWVPMTLARYLRNRKPTVLIANMWALTSAAVLGRILSNQGTKLLLVEHNTLSLQFMSWGRIHNFIMRASLWLTYPRADWIAAVSEGAAQDTARLAGLPLNRVTVLHNPIPMHGTLPREALTRVDELWACPKNERIITVGSFKDQKNHPLLLRAFARLARPAARLMLLGQGEGEAQLRILATELGIAEKVIFAGFHADPAPFYSSASLFVLSSDYEGFGNVIVEALSFGLPVVSTDCPSGPAEILENGRFGLLVPVRDVEALAAAMAQALDTAVDPAPLRARAADFAPEIVAGRYLQLMCLS